MTDTPTTLACGCTLTATPTATYVHPCHPDHLEMLALRALTTTTAPIVHVDDHGNALA